MSLLGNIFGDSKPKMEKVDIAKRYNLIGRVGQGSMSKVWRAEDPMTGQMIAVKVLDKEKTKRYEARFPGLHKPSEGEIAISFKHPYIVKTQLIGMTLEDEMFLIMDYVEGSGLSLLVDLQTDQLRQHRISYMIQLGEALDYFHTKGYIHRDICPRNIMVTEDDKIQLIDFGLTVPNTPDFRKPGNRTGTANYMAPELIKRQPTDQRIDVFSYAVTCFELYTKRHPWDAAMTIDAVLQHINQPPLDIRTLVPRIDSQIAETIMRGLETNPGDRWQTVSDMVAEFRQVEERLVKANNDAKIREKQKAVAKVEASRAQKSGKSAPTAAAVGSAKAKPKRTAAVAGKQTAKPTAAKKTPTPSQDFDPEEVLTATPLPNKPPTTKPPVAMPASKPKPAEDEPDFFGDSDEILALPDTPIDDSGELQPGPGIDDLLDD
ncbi:MAG: protein kinase [Fuerstiella sp.]